MTTTTPGGNAAPAATGREQAGQDDLARLARWVADQPETPAIQLRCDHDSRPARAPAGTIVVQLDRCLGSLSVTPYLEFAAAGVASLTVAATGCPEAQRVALTVAAANQLLAAYPGQAAIALDPPEERWRDCPAVGVRHLPVSRRRLFTFGASSQGRWMPDVSAPERPRMLAALRQLAGAGPAPDGLREVAAPAAALVAGQCTACGVCVRACPNGALRIDEPPPGKDGRFALVARPARCLGCGRCVALCPAGTLTQAGQHDWATLIDDVPAILAAGPVSRCARCGATFAHGGDSRYCSVCAFRREHPFGSQLPPAARPAVTPLTSRFRLQSVQS